MTAASYSFFFESSAGGRVRGRPPHLTTFFSACYGRGAGSPLAWRHPAGLLYCSTFHFTCVKAAPFPRGEFQRLWDGKVTPAYCACQGGNTTCCILNNDGLGAGVVDNFSTREIHGAFIKQLSVASSQ